MFFQTQTFDRFFSFFTVSERERVQSEEGGEGGERKEDDLIFCQGSVAKKGRG